MKLAVTQVNTSIGDTHLKTGILSFIHTHTHSHVYVSTYPQIHVHTFSQIVRTFIPRLSFQDLHLKVIYQFKDFPI